MSTNQILARIESMLMDRSVCDTSIIFSLSNDTFWVRTVIKGSHIEGEGKSLIEAFEKLVENSAH